jgi:TPR repeat protein
LVQLKQLCGMVLFATDALDADALLDNTITVLQHIHPIHMYRDLQLLHLLLPLDQLASNILGKTLMDMATCAITIKSQLLLYLYETGQGTLKLLEERDDHTLQLDAFKLFSIGAMEGHVDCMRELAILYLSIGYTPKLYVNGNSLEASVDSKESKLNQENLQLALAWFDKAALLGDGFSIAYLSQHAKFIHC